MSQQLELLTENPPQWTNIQRLTPEIQKREIKPYVVLALKELEGTPDDRMSSLRGVDKFAAVRAVVRHVARQRSGTRQPWAPEDVSAFLEGLRFSPECTAELTSLLCTDDIYDNVPRHLRVRPGIASLQWKIDLSLSQSSISTEKPDPQRCKEILHRDTYIILIFKLTDGQTRTYRLSIGKFHELRYAVASALKSMIVLEKRKCMRRD